MRNLDPRVYRRQVDEIMNRKGCFFVENKFSGRWLEELTSMGTVFGTDDTLKSEYFLAERIS